MPIIKTISPEMAAEKLRETGIRTNPETIRRGIDQGVYPFGDVIKKEKPIYTIYEKLLERWIAERSG